MRLNKIILTSIFVILFTAINVHASLLDKNTNEDLYTINAKQDIFSFMLAYDDYIHNIEKDSEGFIYLIMKSGKKIIYDDRLEKTNEEKLSNPDLQDMLEDSYTLEEISEVTEKDKNPGRIRSYVLLNEIYGSGEANIRNNLSIAKTPYGNFQFNKQNNASENLTKVLNKVSEIVKINNSVYQYVAPVNGTFNYRLIKDTGRLSPHGYGIAIDLKSNPNDYWKWTTKEEGTMRINKYPKELVDAFEEVGFIWGGKWNCFDILHFEYRPEFIIKAKYFSNCSSKENWYDGIELNNKTLKIIKIIDDALD